MVSREIRRAIGDHVSLIVHHVTWSILAGRNETEWGVSTLKFPAGLVWEPDITVYEVASCLCPWLYLYLYIGTISPARETAKHHSACAAIHKADARDDLASGCDVRVAIRCFM
eukprot:1610471-Rhodomonas_salina.1